MHLLYISYGWYVFLSITGVGLLVALLGWMLYWYYRFLLRSSFLGYSLPMRLINIAITGLIFRTAVNAFMIKPLIMLFSFIKLLIDNIDIVSKDGVEINSGHFIDLFNSLYFEIGNLLSREFLRIDFFLALAFMGGFTLFINKIFYNEASQQYQLPTIKGIRPLQQNLFLFILMAFSLFLVLSAMIAIPVISNPKDFSTASPARYDSLLSNIKDAKANAAPQYILTIPDTSYMDTIKRAFTGADSLPWKQKATRTILSSEKEFVQTYFRNRTEFIIALIERHNKAIQDFEEMKNATFDDIQFKLKERSSRLSFGSEQDYYLYLVSWYSSTLKRAIEFFKSHQAQLKGLGDDLRSKATDISSKFQRYTNDLIAIDTVMLNNSGIIYPIGYFNLNAGLISYDDLSSYSFINTLFNVQQSNKKRTLFESIGDWLVNTNSIDIVLIIGMFGFGLLGAALSSFITAKKEELRDPTTPLVENLSIVIIRGFSAAIVIFLATKGSIAVINSGSNEPNPYVLFFACLVGAVFSEPIWDWAKEKILGLYKKDQNKPALE